MATSPLVFRDIKVRIDDNSDGTTSDESVAQLAVDNGTVVLFVFEFVHKIGGTESPFAIDAAGTPLALRVSINESRVTNSAQLTYQTTYNGGYIASYENLAAGKFTSLVTIDPATCNSFLGTKDEAPAHLTVTLTDADGLIQRLYEAPIIIKAVGADLPAPPPVPAASYLTAAEIAAQYYTETETDALIAGISSDPPTYLELARQATVKRQAYMIYPSASATTSSVLMGTGYISYLYETVSGACTPGTDAGGYNQTFDTGSSTNNEATFGISHYYYHTLPTANFFYWCRFGLSDLTNVRFFCGLTKYGTYNNVIDSDDYGNDHCGLTFSTARPDTNFQFLSRNAAQTLVDTGVAPDAAKIYDLEIEFSSAGASLRMRLSEHDGTVVAADTTITTNLPTLALDPSMGIRTLTTAAAGFRFYRAEMWI